MTIVTPGQWRGICEMMGLPDLARRPHLSLNTDRLKNSAEIDAAFGPVWLTKTAEEWFELGLRYKLPLAVVPTMEECCYMAKGASRPWCSSCRFGLAGQLD